MVLNDAHVRYSAADYNHYTRAFVQPYDSMMASWVCEQRTRFDGSFTLADIGTGTAQLLFKLAAMPELRDCQFIGTDLFPDMISEAEAEVTRAGINERIRLLVDDIHASKLEDESADLVISRSTLHHWSDPVAGLREIYRILRPRGRALIVDVCRDAPAEIIAEFNRQRAEAGITPSVLDEKFTVSEVQEMVRRAGLEEVATVNAGEKGMAQLGLAVSIRKRSATQA